MPMCLVTMNKLGPGEIAQGTDDRQTEPIQQAHFENLNPAN